jgi:hypothetical protein
VVIEELPATVLTKRKGVGVGLQGLRKLEVPLDAVIGIPDKNIVGFVVGMLKRLGPVMTKVLPFVVIDLARDTLLVKKCSDKVFGIIGGSRIGYNIVVKVNVVVDIVEGLHNDVAFVFDDHVEADRFAHCS